MLKQTEVQLKRKLFHKNDLQIVSVFKALSELNRYRVLRLLTENTKLTISNISQILGISVPLVSQHIKILVHLKLLKKNRLGKKVFPEIDHENPFIVPILTTLKKMYTP